MAPTSAPAPAVTTIQVIQATEVMEYRHDFAEDLPVDRQTKKIELDWLIVGVATELEIWCDRPFRLFFMHPHEKRGDYEAWPRDPLPMGVPIRFSNMGWKAITITPYLFPAKLRMWFQRNQEVAD